MTEEPRLSDGGARRRGEINGAAALIGLRAKSATSSVNHSDASPMGRRQSACVCVCVDMFEESDRVVNEFEAKVVKQIYFSTFLLDS